MLFVYADHPDWALVFPAMVTFCSLSLAIYIWLDYREEAAKTRGEKQEVRSTMWRRDRWIATAALLGAGVVLVLLVGE